jgi:hypothetical protein
VHKLKQFTASGLLEDDERLQRVQLSTPQWNTPQRQIWNIYRKTYYLQIVPNKMVFKCEKVVVYKINIWNQ